MKVQPIYNNKLFKKGLEFASDNGALFVATTSLVLSTVARPIAIMSTPKTDKENRKYAAAKSFASSAVGYGLMLCASLPLAKSIKNINKNPSKYLKKETIKRLQSGEKSLSKSPKYKFATQLFKLGLGFLIAVPKSIMTCAMIPTIMNKFFNKDANRHGNIENSRSALLCQQENLMSGCQSRPTSILPSLMGRVSEGQEGLIEEQRAGEQEGRLFNGSSLSEISQKSQTDNPSTLQPFNYSKDTDLSLYRPIALSPENSHTSIPTYVYTSNNSLSSYHHTLQPSDIAHSPQPSPSRGEGVCHDSPSTLQPFNRSADDTDLFAYSPIHLFTNTHSSQNFTGYSTKLSKGIGKIIDTPAIQKLTEKFHSTNFEMHIMALTDTLATGTFIAQTSKSKKIDEDRKNALMYNAGISTGLCIAGGYTIDKLTKKSTDRFIQKFREANKNSPKLEKYIEGIKIVKPALILGSLYYIAIPLISTFLADRFNKSKV